MQTRHFRNEQTTLSLSNIFSFSIFVTMKSISCGSFRSIFMVTSYVLWWNGTAYKNIFHLSSDTQLWWYRHHDDMLTRGQMNIIGPYHLFHRCWQVSISTETSQYTAYCSTHVNGTYVSHSSSFSKFMLFPNLAYSLILRSDSTALSSSALELRVDISLSISDCRFSRCSVASSADLEKKASPTCQKHAYFVNKLITDVMLLLTEHLSYKLDLFFSWKIWFYEAPF